MRTGVLIVLLLVPALALTQPAPLNPGGLEVRVTRNGQPIAGAVVCVGVSGDLNQFFQKPTDSQGRANFGQVPREPFLVTAAAGGAGVQRPFAPASPAGLPFLTVSLSLPVSGGPSCPTSLPGPSRRIINPGTPVFSPAPPFAFKQLNIGHRCFGALGAECGQAQTGLPLTALCSGGSCQVNPGSWDHDECCARNPKGMACQLGPLDSITGHDGSCTAEWDMAVRLAIKGINWRRNVDFSRTNNTGTVEFGLYCAPANSLLPPAEGTKCCSRLTRALNAAEAAAAFAAGETLVACR